MRTLRDLTLLPAAVLGLLVCGCTAGEIELYEPDGGGLGRGLTVKVELEAEAAEIGETLGWSEGVPEAEVRVHRVGTDFSWQTALTDASGVAEFPDLLPGSYRLAAYRVLTDEEAAQLGSRRRALGDGRRMPLSGPGTATLRLAADEPGSLVIGEVYGTAPRVDVTQYDFHHYIEVYNNSDSVIYLDGKILGRGFHGDKENLPRARPCQVTEPLRNDPQGVWAAWFHQFPGSGTDYPLAPGRTAVVAMDAVDHSQFHPAFPDLSHADFEVIGPADVDNPQVPNMPDVGTRPFTGHGMRMLVGSPYFLSQLVEVEGLARAPDPTDPSFEWARFPAEALLDVLATENNDVLEEQQYPLCGQKIHRNFDRLEGGFIEHGVDLEYSVQRIVIDVTPDGRAILQDTNTSAVDLIRALYTVGTLPPQN